MIFVPEKEITVHSESQRKAYFHPIRIKILNHLVKEELTIAQTAKLFNIHPANITHHFKTLEKNNFIKLVREKDTGRVVEKYYRSTAYIFNLIPTKGTVHNANYEILKLLREDITHAMVSLEKSKEEANEKTIGLLENVKISDEKFSEFAKKFFTLLQEFTDSKSENGKNYSMNISLYRNDRDYGPIGKVEILK